MRAATTFAGGADAPVCPGPLDPLPGAARKPVSEDGGPKSHRSIAVESSNGFEPVVFNAVEAPSAE